ncbi:hypothetical protein [Nocardioides sp. SYSU DS0651]|uniref:hypothetical protein n=1 Tax=Nocardioides sp. SYSU DS0651 TaxID=3415955 RepID=UPI003F4B42ED
MYPRIRELAVDEIPVTVAHRMLKIARQPCYRWLQSPVSAAELKQRYRDNALFDAYRDDPAFGYRFFTDEAREAGESVAERTAWQTCSDLSWWSASASPTRARRRSPRRPFTTTCAPWWTRRAGCGTSSTPTVRTSCG